MFLNLLFLLLAQSVYSDSEPFTISIDGPHEITLPYDEDFVLTGNIQPTGNELFDPQLYDVEWTPVTLPKDSKASELLDPKEPLIYRIPKGGLTVSGLYKFSLFVSSTSNSNYNKTAFFDVTVHDMQSKVPLTVNIPPKVVQLPQTHLVLQPEINFEDYPEESLTFKWEEQEVPLSTAELIIDAIKNEASLEIDVAPEAANITFLLTVSDNNSDQKVEVHASLQIIEEKDEPPTAVIIPKEFKITLPTSTAKLCGNSSTDDHEVVEYLWEVENDENPEVVDLSGSHEPCLSINSIRKPGTYHFSLTVADKKGQKDQTTATIIVDPAKNNNPVAKLQIGNVMFSSEGSALYFIPSTKELILNASTSVDPDGDSLTYSFSTGKKVPSKQILTVDPVDQRIARVSNITAVGLYKYLLTVTDDGEPQLSDSVEVVVNVTTGAKPTIVVEDEQTKVGPRANFAIDASRSHSFDDSLLSFSWTADPSVLAGFTVYNNSINSPILQILNANIGTYKFTVTVTDKIGQTNSQIATVNVVEDPEIDTIIEITVYNCPMITKKESKDAETELLLNLADNEPELTKVSITHVFQPFHSPDLVLLAKAYDTFENATETSQVVPFLDGALVSSGGFKSFCRGHPVTARPLVCLSDCSGHGICSNSTKECVCDKFWIRNPMLAYQNCAWSLVYLVLSIFLILISVLAAVIMLTRKRKQKSGRAKKHQKRRSDYAALHALDSETDEDEKAPSKFSRPRKKRPLRARPPKPVKSDHVALIDSDGAPGTSDSDTLFEKPRFSEEIL